ncbi:MAG: signal peptidase I [Lachnospira sp.]
MNLFQRRYQENTVLLNVCKYICDVIIVIVCAYVLVSFLCFRTTVVGSSMESQINNGDTLIINKFAYSVTNPKRFDCIAFEPDSIGSSKVYVKRIIGLPGETVQIKEGAVFIDGNKLDNDISDVNILTAGVAANEIKLGEDEYFCLGDNRNNSEDSRFSSIGTVKKEHIIGKAWMIIGPLDSIGLIK